nr:MAG: ORF1 [Torque teno midi virus]
MPFWWWRRRKRFWNKYRTYRKRWPRRKRRYYKRRRPRRPLRRRRRTRRKHKVRRKQKTLLLRQWQPETIRKCKIKGFIFHTAGANGRQNRCFSDTQFDWVPPRSPGGGGFGYEKFTLETLYKEHLLHHNIWTQSNTFLELVRYTGCSFKVFRHPKIDFIFSYKREYPMTIDKYSYMECHPVNMLLQKHKIVIPSMQTQPHGKNYRKIRIRPPRQMITKWFFQDGFADTGLITILTTQADLKYSYLGPHENTIVTFLAIDTQFYKNCGWGNQSLSTQWYIPYNGAPKKLYKLKLPDGKSYTQDMTNLDYTKSISYENGWFSKLFMQAIAIEDPAESVTPTTIGRYNPHIDTGQGNSIYLISILKSTYSKPLTDDDIILQDRPLWLLLYGFLDWVLKKKGDKTYLESYVLAIESPAIVPKLAHGQFWIPIDRNFYLGKAPFDEYLTPQYKSKWMPKIAYQQETINTIVASGPFVLKLDNSRESTWELHSKYTFYFKWGGSQMPEQDAADPKHQHSYTVPDKLKQAIQVTDPKYQKAKTILHSWDYRRGLATKSAIKRMYENLSDAETLSTASEETPTKKYKGTAIPVQENQETQIQTCLQELFEESTYQEIQENQNLHELINQQRQQQQLIKLNLLQLISDLKNKQQMIQLQTGMLN